MSSNKWFAAALRKARKHRKLTQEDFSDVSSRTYMSTLERGMKSPTLEKIVQLSSVLQIHPVTLVALTYLQSGEYDVPALCEKITSELEALNRTQTSHI